MPPAPWNTELAQSIIAAEASREGALLPILHALNAAFGCVPPAAIPLIATALNLSRAEVHGVVSFYHDFHETPSPARVVRLCRAEACQARGARTLAAEAEAAAAGRADVAVEAVYCLGLCAIGPAAMIGERLVARLDAARLITLMEETPA